MTLIIDNPLLALFIIIGVGLMLGAIRIKNVSLGSSGIIFSSLGMGLFGCSIPAGVDTVGLVLFVYAVGVSAGPGFFRVFVRQGARLAKLGLFTTAVGATTAVLLAMIWHMPAGLTAGIFAGSLTSTPALAAALDVVSDDGAVSVGYGIAYPCGVVIVVLFVQFVPRILRLNLQAEARDATSDMPQINRVLVEVKNPMLFGRKVQEVGFLGHHRCTLSRMLEGDQLVPITPDTTFQRDMIVLAVGEREALDDLVELVGKVSEHKCYIDADTRKEVVLTSPDLLGKRIGELNLLATFGLSIYRVSRHGVEFVPTPKTMLQQADILTVG